MNMSPAEKVTPAPPSNGKDEEDRESKEAKSQVMEVQDKDRPLTPLALVISASQPANLHQI